MTAVAAPSFKKKKVNTLLMSDLYWMIFVLVQKKKTKKQARSGVR